MARAFHEIHRTLQATILSLVIPDKWRSSTIAERREAGAPGLGGTGGCEQGTDPRDEVTGRLVGTAPPPTYYRVPMTSADGSDEFRRRFDEIVAEMSPDDIHEMLG